MSRGCSRASQKVTKNFLSEFLTGFAGISPQRESESILPQDEDGHSKNAADQAA